MSGSSGVDRVAYVGDDGQLRLLDATSGAELATTSIGSDTPSCLVMAPGEPRLPAFFSERNLPVTYTKR